MQQAHTFDRDGSIGFDDLKSLNSAIATVIDQVCSLKPEVALLLELYEAEKEGKLLSASSLGLIAGIAQTTTIRHIRYLEKRGWVTRSRHETDQRINYIRIAPALVAAFDRVFGR